MKCIKNNKILKQNLDLNLFYIYELIHSTNSYIIDKDIRKELNKLLKFIEKKLFKKIPHGYDIYNTKCVYYIYLEHNN